MFERISELRCRAPGEVIKETCWPKVGRMPLCAPPFCEITVSTLTRRAFALKVSTLPKFHSRNTPPVPSRSLARPSRTREPFILLYPVVYASRNEIFQISRAFGKEKKGGAGTRRTTRCLLRLSVSRVKTDAVPLKAAINCHRALLFSSRPEDCVCYTIAALFN